MHPDEPLEPSNEPQAPGPSPLAETDPSSLDEEFSRDLAALSPEQRAESVRRIVTELRRQRVAWKVAEAFGATKAPKAKRAAKPGKTSLADLGLDE